MLNSAHRTVGALYTVDAGHWLLAQGVDRVFNPQDRTRLSGELEFSTEEVEDEEGQTIGERA